ncbi:MAG: M13 family metallopeptidase [Rickettsiales bacterium]|jgi:putative endopeptidase|nr:M13 family metallopeptidase [Rickettsiales bacterium]
MKNKLLNIVGIIAVAFAIGLVVFIQKERKMSMGVKLENMDLSARPGDDFYDYATLGWRRANPIPDDYSRYGVFDELREVNMQRVRDIAENDKGKIGLLYKIAMDGQKLNSEDVRPMQKFLARIDDIKTKAELPEYLGRMHKHSSSFWSDGVALDEMNSEYYLYNIRQGGIGLSRDYYFDTDEKSAEIRAKYKKYIADIMKRFDIAGDAGKIYALEERMAKSFYKKESLRDPHANYHKMTLLEFKKKFAGFDWDAYLDARGAKIKDININQPEPVAESLKIISDADLDLLKTYLKFRLASSNAALLDDETYDIKFDFYNRVMSGQKEKKPRWKRAVSLLDGSLGEEIGRLYTDEYFPPAAKERMQNLVENLRRAYGSRIESLEWMSAETKAKALEKLAAFKAKIGYPDKWRDYSALEIKDDSLVENIRSAVEFEDKFWLDKIGQKVDPTIWYMNAHEVNAYYDPSTNEICFPAGILQPPFFDMAADDAFNYGAIGSVIGHEMTHGFDDQGRKFDKDGNLKDWWTDADAKAFDSRAQVMRKFFDNIEVAPNTKANGEYTLGENLADYGGIAISFAAYEEFGKVSAGGGRFSPRQIFFIAYAGTETGNIRDAEILRLTKMDVHSLSRWRVNGILPHIDAWYDAFGIKPDDKLYLAPDKRVKIW